MKAHVVGTVMSCVASLTRCVMFCKYPASSQGPAWGLGHGEPMLNGEQMRLVMFVLFLSNDIDDSMRSRKGAAPWAQECPFPCSYHTFKMQGLGRSDAAECGGEGTWMSRTRWTALGTFHLKCRRVCLSVVLLSYRIACL